MVRIVAQAPQMFTFTSWTEGFVVDLKKVMCRKDETGNKFIGANQNKKDIDPTIKSCVAVTLS